MNYENKDTISIEIINDFNELFPQRKVINTIDGRDIYSYATLEMENKKRRNNLIVKSFLGEGENINDYHSKLIGLKQIISNDEEFIDISKNVITNFILSRDLSLNHIKTEEIGANRGILEWGIYDIGDSFKFKRFQFLNIKIISKKRELEEIEDRVLSSCNKNRQLIKRIIK